MKPRRPANLKLTKWGRAMATVARVVDEEPEGSEVGVVLCEVAGVAGAPRPYAGKSTRMKKPLSALFPIAAQERERKKSRGQLL